MSLADGLRKKASEHRELAAKLLSAGLTDDAQRHAQWADDLDEQADAMEEQ